MPKILIVEDNKINQLVLAGLLKNLGEENVVFADDGAVAVEVVKREKIDLIFMDSRMPIMDGYTSAREIRKIEKANSTTPVPIVGTSANSGQEEMQKCLDANMTDYMSKPIKESRLKEILEQLSRKETRRETNVDFTNIETLGDSEIAAQLVSVFSESVTQQFEKLCAAFENKDQEKCDFILHSIKGIAGNIGAVAVTDQIDILSKTDNSQTEKVEFSLKVLEKSIQNSLKEMNEYISSSK